MQHFCFLAPFFKSWTQISKTFSMYTKGLFLSNIVHKSVYICVSEQFSFAELIHLPHRCGILRCWLDSMIIAQVCLRLATINGHSKMCSFTVLGVQGGLKTSQYLVWPPFAFAHHLTTNWSWLLIVACGMLVHSSSMAVRSCWILAGTGTRCHIRRSTASQTCSMGDMSGEYAGHARTGMISASRICVQILATWGRALSCCNMRWWSWMNNTTMGLRISSLYLCAFKMPSIKWTTNLCSLSITYACPYHNPTATMGHSIHNVDISKPLTHTTPYTQSAICLVQWKPGFIREENTSPKCQTPSNVSICPLKSVTTINCSQVETPMRMTSMQMSFPETVSNSLCRNSLVMPKIMPTDCCSSCGWSQTILEVKMLDPGLVWLHMVCGCEASWMYCQILWKAFRDGL